ncbi:Late embryogenesis abundant protein [Carex littledalei]|uniref:Late embryogenesis abundant protein n=1 Tax=Carex littledalei TaxID=544730 RepID=A0A833VEL1_9POAL|nr:Late embryogenesis abundant protein [Carex littledalei]
MSSDILLHLTNFNHHPNNNSSSSILRHVQTKITRNKFCAGVDVTVKNKNYAAFKIKRTNTTIYYHETLVGEASVDPRVVSARSTSTLNTTVDIDVATMMRSGSFLADMASGLLPFTSETKTTGKVIILNVFKLHATVDVLCNVRVSLIDSTTNTICNTTVHV